MKTVRNIKPEINRPKRRIRVSYVREKLNTDNTWLLKALLKIYSFQTIDEQSSESTNHDNGVGFNGIDAPFLTSISKQYLKKGSLSEKQIYVCRKKMLKYSSQLARIINDLGD